MILLFFCQFEDLNTPDTFICLPVWRLSILDQSFLLKITLMLLFIMNSNYFCTHFINIRDSSCCL